MESTKQRMLALVLAALLSYCAAQPGAPVFEPLFSPSGVQTAVDERAPLGTTVLEARAQGSSGETIRYGIELLPTDLGVFVIGPETGVVAVGLNGTSRLIIQNGMPAEFMFAVYAYYSTVGPDGDRGYLPVTVTVRDINDPPLFVDAQTDIAVTEGNMGGEIVHRFVAVNNDLGGNSAITYSLQQLSPVGNYFFIHPLTGDLISTQSLNISQVFELWIIATDGGSPPLNSSILVTVRVDPIPPVFDNFVYTASLTEFTGPVPVILTTVRAIDANPGDSPGTIAYRVDTWLPSNNAIAFDVGDNSGVVTVAGNVDRETFSRYTVIVSAYEQEHHPEASTSTTLVVDVLDVNEPPQFLSSHYSASIPEGTMAGETFFLGIEAVDNDEGTNSDIIYSIDSIDGLLTENGERVSISEPFFIINPGNAWITVNTDLEREAAVDGYHYYEIIVLATDAGSPPLSTNTTLAISITDVNDNPPIFQRDTYLFLFSENEPADSHIGTFVVSDSDENAAANISFTLEGPYSDRFRVEVSSIIYPPSVDARPPIITTGRLVSAIEIDREDIGSYTFTVIAQDTSRFPLNDTATITVNILDRNDNVPQFTNSNFTFELQEETLNDSQPLLIQEFRVTDNDEGVNGEVDFSLEPGIAQLHFSLSSEGQTTQLFLDLPLDREQQDSLMFRVFAIDRGTPSQVGITLIIVDVTDINDNSPVFVDPQYNITVRENTPVNTSLLTVEATDADIGINGELEYHIFSDVERSPFLLGITSTGAVFLDSVPDYETYFPLFVGYLFRLLASDSGEPSRFGMATISIEVLDENDNAPVFQNNTAASFSEDIAFGGQVTQVTAEDLDSGRFGEVSYYIVGGNDERKFTINNMTGIIQAVGQFDREQRNQYNLTVLAMDGGEPSLSTETGVLLTVLDSNDNTPVFIGGPYSATIPEGFGGSVGEYVLTVLAVDADIVENGEIRYSLSGSEAEHFTIDAVTGDIRVSALGVDYEDVQDTPYVFTVVAIDQGAVPRINTTTVSITLTDTNDHQPIYLDAPYTVTVPELTTGPEIILNVTAVDPDISPDNRAVRYSISDETDTFTIDSITGCISVVSGVSLDRESPTPKDEDGNAVYTFGVIAFDLGTPVQISLATVTILVTDVNDNAPVFLPNSLTFFVSEGLPANAIISTLLAVDDDVGTNAAIVYGIDTQTPNLGVFSIGPLTGELTLYRELDREEQNIFFLVINATDQGEESNVGQATVTVNVTDENDNHPVFLIPPGGYVARISENSSTAVEVITVEATDIDLGQHREIRYSLNTTGVPFQIIDPTVGRITLSGQLDRETQPEYRLIVVASDTPPDFRDVLETSAMVTVFVDDVNDNAPMFDNSAYSGRVDENVPPGTTVEVMPPISVSDADIGINTEFVYGLAGNGSAFFSINNTTGVITTATILSNETVTEFTELILTATDVEDRRSTATISIIVGDVNDHTPMFITSAADNISVPENLQVGEIVTVIRAFDLDSGENGMFNFSLTSDEGLFEIESDSGVVRLSAELDYELEQSHEVVISVVDRGDPPRQSYLFINISVLDVNDNAPVILNPSPEFTVLENSDNTTFIGRIVSADNDSLDIGRLVHAIVGGNGMGRFRIDFDSGDIFVAGNIDREEQETYQLIIEVLDTASNFVTTNAAVTVLDVNDNGPMFPSTMVSVELLESAEMGQEVTEFTAMDGDFGSNGTLVYDITSSTPASHFNINATTGVVTVSSILDYESITSYLLNITATDSGSPPLTGSGILQIVLLDINDNAPVFVTDPVEETLPENSKNGSLVASLLANDSDSGSNAEITYSITRGNTGDAFYIDNTSGMVIVQNQSALDFETTQFFLLQIEARDMGIPSLSSQASLILTLTDENDNVPEFPLGNQSVTIPEDSEAGRIVMVTTAEDSDEGANGELSYFIAAGDDNGVFEITADGTIVVNGTLDYETTTQYDLIVEASDRGNPPLTGTAILTVFLMDVNDNQPIFVHPLEDIVVPEDTPVGSNVSQIIAFDADSGNNGEITFRSITVSGSEIFFTISDTTGVLTLAQSLDRENVDRHYIRIEVSDRGTPPLNDEREFVIAVGDVDDSTPQFLELTFTIPEDHPLFSPFRVLATTDADIGSSADAFFAIVGGEDADKLGVTATGSVFFTNPVDREEKPVLTALVAAAGTLIFPGTCEASDICTIATMTVILEDVNDNAPMWQKDRLLIGVNRSVPVNGIAAQVQAEDPDSGNFGTLQYELNTAAASFILDPETGILRLNRTLDGTESNEMLSITAYDNFGQSPTFSSTVAIQVYFISEENLVILAVRETVAEVKEKLDQLQSVFDSIMDADIAVYTLQTSSSGQTSKQTSGAMLTLFGVDPVTNATLSSIDLLSILEINIDAINQVVTVETVQVNPTLPPSDEGVGLLLILYIVIGVLGGLVLIFAFFFICICCLVTRRKKTTRMGTYNPRDHKHRTLSSDDNFILKSPRPLVNPVYNKYERWSDQPETTATTFKEVLVDDAFDRDRSRRLSEEMRESVLYESQEYQMQFFADCDEEGDGGSSGEHDEQDGGGKGAELKSKTTQTQHKWRGKNTKEDTVPIIMPPDVEITYQEESDEEEEEEEESYEEEDEDDEDEEEEEEDDM